MSEITAEIAAKVAAAVATGLVQWVLVPVGVYWRDCLPADATSLVIWLVGDIDTGCDGCVAYTVKGTTPNDIEWVLQVIETPRVPAKSVLF